MRLQALTLEILQIKIVPGKVFNWRLANRCEVLCFIHSLQKEELRLKLKLFIGLQMCFLHLFPLLTESKKAFFFYKLVSLLVTYNRFPVKIFYILNRGLSHVL